MKTGTYCLKYVPEICDIEKFNELLNPQYHSRARR